MNAAFFHAFAGGSNHRPAHDQEQDHAADLPQVQHSREIDVLILYGLTIVFPQTRVPFERVIKNGEAVEVVAKDTFYDLAGLVGLGDSTALNVVKETPVQGSPYNLGEALSRACSSSSWRATKRDGKSAAVFTGTLKDSKDALSVVYTVEGDHCSLLSVTLNGEPQTAQMLEAIVSNAVK